MTLPRYEYGEEVRLIRNVRNDGTYPGMDTGTLLVRRGETGYVRDVGTFLQDQLIYKVHFMGAGRVVGCREEELIPATDPWVPNKFEFREKVVTTQTLAVRGEILVEQGEEGEVFKVVRDLPQGIQYHVHFENSDFGNGKILQVPEDCLVLAENQVREGTANE